MRAQDCLCQDDETDHPPRLNHPTDGGKAEPDQGPAVRATCNSVGTGYTASTHTEGASRTSLFELRVMRRPLGLPRPLLAASLIAPVFEKQGNPGAPTRCDGGSGPLFCDPTVAVLPLLHRLGRGGPGDRLHWWPPKVVAMPTARTHANAG